MNRKKKKISRKTIQRNSEPFLRGKKKPLQGKVVKRGVELRPPAKRGSKYEKVISMLDSLKKGESLIVECDEPGMSSRTLHNRLNAAFHRNGVDTSCFVKRTTASGDVAIMRK